MIGPVAALENYVFRAFTFRGRATRAEYWWIFLAKVLLYVGSVIVDVIALSMTDTPSLNPFAYATVVVFVLNMVPSVTLTARRLHDTGRSSFWWLVNLVPFIGPFWLLAILTARSEQEDNRWGPIPGPSGMKAVTRVTAEGKVVKHNPWQGYAVLLNAEREKSADELAAQREQIEAYYREKVLRARPSAG